MRVLFLTGIFSKTEAWAAKVLAASGGADWQSRVQRYSHWGSGNEENMDVAAERDRLSGEKADLLFGKSMGALLALMAVAEKLISPARLIVLGVPANICRERGIDLAALATKVTVPTLCIQQTDDKTGSCTELRRRLAGNSLFTIHEIAGEDHQYKDLPQLARIIKKWLSA
jgi:pimeloyl-ACP methyl ester carboxylesterase